MIKLKIIIISILSILILGQIGKTIRLGDNTYNSFNNLNNEEILEIKKVPNNYYFKNESLDLFTNEIIKMLKEKNEKVYKLINIDSLNGMLNDYASNGVNINNYIITGELKKITTYEVYEDTQSLYSIELSKREGKNIKKINTIYFAVTKVNSNINEYKFEFLYGQWEGGTD